jgi:hypothetical protein
LTNFTYYFKIKWKIERLLIEGSYSYIDRNAFIIYSLVPSQLTCAQSTNSQGQVTSSRTAPQSECSYFGSVGPLPPHAASPLLYCYHPSRHWASWSSSPLSSPPEPICELRKKVDFF